jgi:hypothetical protein
MSTQLDLDDVAATSELARKQLNALRAENKRLRDLLERHLADNPKNSKNYCNCQLCQDTRAALGD